MHAHRVSQTPLDRPRFGNKLLDNLRIFRLEHRELRKETAPNSYLAQLASEGKLSPQVRDITLKDFGAINERLNSLERIVKYFEGVVSIMIGAVISVELGSCYLASGTIVRAAKLFTGHLPDALMTNFEKLAFYGSALATGILLVVGVTHELMDYKTFGLRIKFTEAWKKIAGSDPIGKTNTKLN